MLTVAGPDVVTDTSTPAGGGGALPPPSKRARAKELFGPPPPAVTISPSDWNATPGAASLPPKSAVATPAVPKPLSWLPSGL
ncbi:hypothetical protein [Streptomyces sp. NPDC086182]|jgi:hypothetical protein|uniref:hypothetical protein n=1 Tax=Streptomyces sp. NPDC086182 TaxID=3155058 RepID=UPI00342A4A83